jgi:hypothetical protein
VPIPDGHHREVSMLFQVPCIDCGRENYDEEGKIAAMRGRREEPLNDLDQRLAEKDLRLVRICGRCVAKAEKEEK